MHVVFRFNARDMDVEVEGPEEFVRPHLEFLAPFVRGVTGAGEPARAASGAPAPPATGIEGVASWWAASVPPGANPSIQDTILLFAFYMRTYRKTVFLSEDVRRCFQVLGMEEPRSLLQILGTLKREHGLLLNAGKRGEYMMNTTGIARAREILGVKPSAGGTASPPAPGAPGSVDAKNLFKD